MLFFHAFFEEKCSKFERGEIGMACVKKEDLM